MKKTQNRKIIAALKDLDSGLTQKEVAKKYGIFQGTLSKWKAKYGILTENIPCSNQNIPSSDENIPSDSIPDIKVDNNIPSFIPDSEIPSEGGWFNGIFYDPIDPNYDYDDEGAAIAEKHSKKYGRNSIAGLYFDKNSKLKLKSSF